MFSQYAPSLALLVLPRAKVELHTLSGNGPQMEEKVRPYYAESRSVPQLRVYVNESHCMHADVSDW